MRLRHTPIRPDANRGRLRAEVKRPPMIHELNERAEQIVSIVFSNEPNALILVVHVYAGNGR